MRKSGYAKADRICKPKSWTNPPKSTSGSEMFGLVKSKQMMQKFEQSWHIMHYTVLLFIIVKLQTKCRSAFNFLFKG